jgi:hypothetical protein
MMPSIFSSTISLTPKVVFCDWRRGGKVNRRVRKKKRRNEASVSLPLAHHPRTLS